MILIQKSAIIDFPACSFTLLRLTKVLTAEIGILSTKFVECLNKQEGDDELKVNQLVTNIYLEASNSSSYIQDGFQLLLPVLQQAAIERNQAPQD
ncbi:protein FAM114A2-like [Mercenaria mercenaria]|uniref:protein FAM114A2-like n=1 Tax=Mercenaria mercenaria TaxID=6596 RepID=UPI00234E67E3|nr:protein FAM114A2-like [Mercenaria mercenaria]